MDLTGKAWSIGTSVTTVVAATIVGSNRLAAWKEDNPVTKEWLNQRRLTKREKSADFVDKVDTQYFGLGCHRVILEGKNVSKLYTDETVVKYPRVGTPTREPLPDTNFLGSSREPLIGCSTAYKKDGNVYEFELAFRQGDKGFEERISVHSDKIVSQIVFYVRRTPNRASSMTFKHTFGLYKYIKQDSSNIYQVANPVPTGGSVWSSLTLSAPSAAPSAAPSPAQGAQASPSHNYFVVWMEDPNGQKIFDNLGVKSNGKIFSSVSEERIDHVDASDFVFIDKRFTFFQQIEDDPVKKSGGGQDQQNQKDPNSVLTQKTMQRDQNLKHFDLSVLSSFAKLVGSKRGYWKSIESFCSSAESSSGARRRLKEMRKLSQYCYEVKTNRLGQSSPRAAQPQNKQ